MKLKEKVQAFVNQQYKFPKGLIGSYFGEKMVWQHKPETLWTIDLLNLQQGNRVLELGCGSGYAMKLILEHNSVDKVIGLDISPTVSEIHRVLNPGDICVIPLCNGKGEESWAEVNQLINEQVVPLMKKIGFTETRVVKGPNSRQFHTVAISAKKNFGIV